MLFLELLTQNFADDNFKEAYKRIKLQIRALHS